MAGKFQWNMKNLTALPKKNQLLIVVLVGILLLVIAIPSGEKSKKGGSDTENVTDTGAAGKTYENYEERMEKKVAEALQNVEGVGHVEVILTLKSSGQKVVEKDQQSSNQSTAEEDSQGGTRENTDSSSDKRSVYEQAADGTQTPYVSKELTPDIEGVVVIASGGDNGVVVQNITEAIQALFGVEAHKIKIMKRNDS